MRIVSFVSVFLIAFLSCTKIYTYDVDQIEPRIILNGLITPDSSIKVSLLEEASLNQQINQYQYFSAISDATIVLYENEQAMDTLTYDTLGIYSSTIKPAHSKLYQLKATSPRFPKVSAEIAIPKKVKIDSLCVSSYKPNEYFSYEVKMTFYDDGAADNDYLFFIDGKNWVYADYEAYSSALGDWNSKMVQLPIFTNALFQGSKHELYFKLNVKNYQDSVKSYLYFNLYKLSKDYFTYIQNYNKQAPKQSDDLLAMFQSGLIEPIPIYSNVTGGLGIFASYSVDTDSLYFEP